MLRLLGVFVLYGLMIVGWLAAIAGLIIGNWLLYQRLRSPNWNIARRRVKRQLIQLWVSLQRQ